MKNKKRKLLNKAMKEFKRNGGGTAVDDLITESPAKITRQLNASLKKIVESLAKKTKK